MCGGTLETHVCSHIGHVFRQKAPYSHPGGGDVLIRNSVRVAEVWMDDYKELYYARQRAARKIDPGDMRDRDWFFLLSYLKTLCQSLKKVIAFNCDTISSVNHSNGIWTPSTPSWTMHCRVTWSRMVQSKRLLLMRAACVASSGTFYSEDQF